MTDSSRPPLILASGSTYRAELLRRLNISFAQHSPDIDESPLAGEKPAALAARLAREKAAAVAPEHPDSLIIASDQVASLQGEILGKPGTAQRAAAQLGRCSAQKVTFYTSLHVTGHGETQETVESFSVYFRELSSDQIQRYIEHELPLDCAGSFKMEGLGISLFEKLEGSDPNTLIGLPLIALTSFLNQRGIAIP